MKNCFMLLFASVFLLSSCNFVARERVKGNNIYTTEERGIISFTKVSVYGSMDVLVSEGPSAPIKIEAEENILPYIELEENGDELKIKFRNNINITTHRAVKVYLQAPRYEGFRLFGSGDIQSENQLSNPSAFKISLTGSGNIRLQLDAPDVEVQTTGSGDVFLKGNTRDLDAQTTGSGNLHLEELKAENVEVKSHGSGSAWVFASQSLKARTHGSGDVSYKGEAEVDAKVSGSGSVKKF